MASLFPFGVMVTERRQCRERPRRGVLKEVWAATKKKSATRSRQRGAALKATPLDVKKHRPVRNGQQHIKKELLRGLSEITTNMIISAIAGGTAPLKLLWELGGLKEDPTSRQKKREPSLGRLLTEALRKQEADSKKREQEAGKKK